MKTGRNSLRKWQSAAMAKVIEGWLLDPNYKALIAACPGAGKTQCAGEIAVLLLRDAKIQLTLVLAPTVNIQLQWVDEFKKFGITATCTADNEALRLRRDLGGSMRENNAVIVVTYAQVSRDAELFAELVKRHPTLLIADEVHHADDNEEYGKATSVIKDGALHSLALSGTPFNTAGGSLALCETDASIDDETGKPVRVTRATFTYSYGDALNDNKDNVCREVVFVKVEGSGRATYRSLTDNTLFNRLVKTSRKSDGIGLLFDPNGEYMAQCIREALTALTRMREASDKRAAMLVVAKDVKHGNRLIETIERIKQEKPEWSQFSNIQEIYNDTEKAHDRIRDLNGDSTDIIVSVRMISEGVDIKRLRVGIYATNVLTRMFFIQFVGRFVRYETRSPLDGMQYSVVVCPAHPLLLKWTREIEKMILASTISLDADDKGSSGIVRKSELVEVDTRADGTTLTARGEELENQADLVEKMRRMSDVFKVMSPAQIIKVASDLGIGTGKSGTTVEPASINWRERNKNISRTIVRYQRANGETDAELFGRVNAKANNHVGIKRIDGMTPDNILEQRWLYLKDMLRGIIGDMTPDIFGDEA